jgi:hypothetical protein
MRSALSITKLMTPNGSMVGWSLAYRTSRLSGKSRGGTVLSTRCAVHQQRVGGRSSRFSRCGRAVLASIQTILQTTDRRYIGR